MRIAILGASGMLGSQLFQSSLERGLDVIGIARDTENLAKIFSKISANNLVKLNDVKDFFSLEEIIKSINPDYLINCIGIVKQSDLSKNHIESITINSLLPHVLEELGNKLDFKLIHVSTDCVFDGEIGNYKESDSSSANDLYGVSKFLGEVNYGKGITLRTSIIGHEISRNKHGLVDWFLGASSPVNGYKKAIFSGLTTYELSNVIFDKVIPLDLPAGTYHVSVDPITKFDLLSLVNEIYCLNKTILPSEELVIDRSLDSSYFRKLVNYEVPCWKHLIEEMKINQILKRNN
jgi:dTDP-4-dehydrorhamnose reductase